MSSKNKNLFEGTEVVINPQTNQKCSKELLYFLGGW